MELYRSGLGMEGVGGGTQGFGTLHYFIYRGNFSKPQNTYLRDPLPKYLPTPLLSGSSLDSVVN